MAKKGKYITLMPTRRVGLILVLGILFCWAGHASAALISLSSLNQLENPTTIGFEDNIGFTSNEYESQGVIFSSQDDGFTTYVYGSNVNPFVGLISGGGVGLPGAPFGIHGSKFIFTNPVSGFGMEVRGNVEFNDPFPFSPTFKSSPFVLRAYDSFGVLLGEFNFDPVIYVNSIPTDPGPMFAGIASTDALIGRGELLYLAPQGYSFDNLSFSQGSDQGEPSGSPVPEPSSIYLLGSGLLGLAGWRRRQRYLSR